MAIVELETPQIKRLFAKLMALQPGQGLQVNNLRLRTFNRLKSKCWREEITLGKTDEGGGVITLMLKPRYRPVGYFSRKSSPLEVLTAEEEGERFSAAVRKFCERRRIQIPRSSQLLEIAKAMGYARTSAPDFDDWLAAGSTN